MLDAANIFIPRLGKIGKRARQTIDENGCRSVEKENKVRILK